MLNGRDTHLEETGKIAQTAVYRVGKQIGSGGFGNVSFVYQFETLSQPSTTGRVYEAKGWNGELVALKKSHITKHIANPMLRHEVCALSLLAGHPSFPNVHVWGRSQYFEYLVMDLLGRPMTSLLEVHTRLNLRSTLLLTDQLVSRPGFQPANPDECKDIARRH